MSEHRSARNANATTREDAFSRHVLGELPALRREAQVLASSSHDAEDLFQETLMRAFRSIDGFDGRYPRAWLRTIMRNVHINEWRRRRRELPIELPGTHDRTQEPGPEDTVMRNLAEDEFTRRVRALPPRYRDVVALVDIADVAPSDVADQLGIPAGTVGSRLHRGRARLRRAYGEPVDVPPAA